MLSDITDYIFTWFYENTKPGSHNIGSLYRGLFYFDSCFWQVDIPIICGSRVMVYPLDSLISMPDKLKKQVESDQHFFCIYRTLWIKCVDYAYGYDDILKLSHLNQLAINFIKSAHKELQATVSLLLEQQPQPKAIETARMAVEMYLKAILIIKNGWSEQKEVKKISHDLIKAVHLSIKLTDNQELKLIKDKLNFFPEVNSRYEGKECKVSELWHGYVLAQAIGTIFTRMFSNRDTRPQILSSNRENL